MLYCHIANGTIPYQTKYAAYRNITPRVTEAKTMPTKIVTEDKNTNTWNIEISTKINDTATEGWDTIATGSTSTAAIETNVKGAKNTATMNKDVSKHNKYTETVDTDIMEINDTVTEGGEITAIGNTSTVTMETKVKEPKDKHVITDKKDTETIDATIIEPTGNAIGDRYTNTVTEDKNTKVMEFCDIVMRASTEDATHVAALARRIALSMPGLGDPAVSFDLEEMKELEESVQSNLSPRTKEIIQRVPFASIFEMARWLDGQGCE